MHLHVLVPFIFVATTKLAFAQTIDPNSVDDTTKDKWCIDQKSTCPLICLQLPGANGRPKENQCDSDTLVFSCICSNGQSPNASQFSQTIPFYECQTAATQCVNNCPSSDSKCQSSCRTAHPCGAQNPTRVNITSSSSIAATPTDGSAASETGFGAAQSSSAGSSDASLGKTRALALGFGRTYGLVAVFISIFGGFAFML